MGHAAKAAHEANDPDLLTDEAIERVRCWLEAGEKSVSRRERRIGRRLGRVVADRSGVGFALRFVDRVIRPEDHAIAARQLASLVGESDLPSFLSPVDRLLLRWGARIGLRLPGVVIPLAERRMRALIGHLVVDSEPRRLTAHLRRRASEGFSLNVNLLGEAVLGDAEASRRRHEVVDLLSLSNVDCVSVKVSSVVAQINHWDFDGSLPRVVDGLRPLFRAAAAASPAKLVNLDMEEYHDLELTLSAFKRLLDEPEFHGADAGIALQAYLPDSFAALQSLVEWRNDQAGRRGDRHHEKPIKIRLVKGANLGMEKVDAAMHGWPQAPYLSKAETDANFKRCLDWVLTPEHTSFVRVGVASHNLFDVAWADLLAAERGVSHRVEFEMLEGMAPAQARRLLSEGKDVLVYLPVVAEQDFDVAISYLFRRLEENASPDNFIHKLLDLDSNRAAFESEAAKFRAAVAGRLLVENTPRRQQERRRSCALVDSRSEFFNESDTDPVLGGNRAWAQDLFDKTWNGPTTRITHSRDVVDQVVASAIDAQQHWARLPSGHRRELLWRVADELRRRRGDLVAAMVQEGRKTLAQADPEVSEAIDFARWYGDRALDLVSSEAARFEPLGVVLVVPPWNFPVAIPAGGVLAALAAGNSAILKPAPETPLCAEIVAQCCWEAGVPRDLVGFVRTPDDKIGQHLITHPGVDAVILTGAYETAEMFQSWRPGLRLFAETSGKNAMVITPSADMDLAVSDLVASAFDHSGQKCSAASMAICVGKAYTSPRLRRQLADAVNSLQVGPTSDPGSAMGPVIREPDGKLLRALTRLDPGEEWLVEPQQMGPNLWTPGVRVGVKPESWFGQTECFGPVLGLAYADSLDHAVTIQNSNQYGLTGGIHSLDPAEIRYWLDTVEVGNAYVNRPTTGAIVQRQPFGGWKRSCVGPGAKAGGPNYITHLGTWIPLEEDLTDQEWLERAHASDEAAWREEYSVDHDPAGLFCESNILRYRPLNRVGLRIEADAAHRDVARVRTAAKTCGVELVDSLAEEETGAAFAARLSRLGIQRLRSVGSPDAELQIAAQEAGIHFADSPVTRSGRIEMLHYLREQSVSQTTHRYGNVWR